MKRRTLSLLLGSMATAWPVAVKAQRTSRVVKVGILAYGNQATSPVIESFRREMSRLGYVEGRDLAVEFRSAAGNSANLPSLAAELVKVPVDVIVTDGLPASLAAWQ